MFSGAIVVVTKSCRKEKDIIQAGNMAGIRREVEKVQEFLESKIEVRMVSVARSTFDP